VLNFLKRAMKRYGEPKSIRKTFNQDRAATLDEWRHPAA
jgi:hypothetical protein